jgi:hypothetical protein
MQVSLTIVGTFDEDWAAGSNPPFTLKMTFGGVESEDVSLETKEYLENLFRRGVMIPVGRRLKDEVECKRKRRGDPSNPCILQVLISSCTLQRRTQHQPMPPPTLLMPAESFSSHSMTTTFMAPTPLVRRLLSHSVR